MVALTQQHLSVSASANWKVLLARYFCRMWFDRHIVEDGVIIGNGAPERCAVSGKPAVELVLDGFQLHIVAEYTLASITIIRRRGQKGFKLKPGESRPSIDAYRKMCRENREAGEGGSITRIIEDPYCPLVGDGYGWNGSLYLPGNEDFRTNGQPAGTIIGQPAHCQPIIAGSRIAVAVNIDHVAPFAGPPPRDLHRPAAR